MKTRELIDYYGGIRQLAQEFDVWPQVVYMWGEYPPMGRQYEAEVRTGGVLKAERGTKEATRDDQK